MRSWLSIFRLTPVDNPYWGQRRRENRPPTRWVFYPWVIPLGLFIGYRLKTMPLAAFQQQEAYAETPMRQSVEIAEGKRDIRAEAQRPIVKARSKFDPNFDPVLNPYLRKGAYIQPFPTWLIGARNCLGLDDPVLSEMLQLLRNRKCILPAEFYNLHEQITKNPEDVFNELPRSIRNAPWYVLDTERTPPPAYYYLSDEQLRRL